MGLAVAVASTPVSEADGLRVQYIQGLRLIERLHRLMLDVIKDEFDRLSITELNSVQALLLNNIGDEELTAGELRSRGYYLGSNVSYNLKKLVEMGYIDYQRSQSDRRSVRIRLTDKGKKASDVVDLLYERQLGSLNAVAQLNQGDFLAVNGVLGKLERFWTDQIRFRL